MRFFLTATMLLTFLLSTLLLSNTFAGSTYNNTSQKPFTIRKLNLREEGLDIKGELPEMYNLDKLGVILTDQIKETYRQKVAAAKESKARSILFEWEFYTSGNVSSLLLKTTITTAVSKEEVNSFNFAPDGSRIISVNDVIGPNGLQIANKVISQRIRANSEFYYASFPGLQSTDAFYVSDGEIVFLFDAFKIAPGSAGVIPFPLEIDSVINSRLVKKDEGYWVNKSNYGLKMVSLRAVCRDLRYTVDWNRTTKKTTVERVGDITVTLKTDDNIYESSRPNAPNKIQSRSLESAPTIVDGVTYVPISFFDQILELVAYHVDDNGNIIFSTYIEN